MSKLEISYTQLQKIYAEDVLDTALAHSGASRNYVWHVALPKSGSTWCSQILARLFAKRGFATSVLVPDHAQRPQEIDPRLFITPQSRDVFFRQQMCLHSLYTEKLIKATNTKIIFQYRNLEDALMSRVDHYRDALFGSKEELHTMVKGAWSLDESELNDYVIDTQLPWCCQFLSGWLTSDLARSKAFYRLDYDLLNASPSSAVRNLSDALDLGFSQGEIEEVLEKVSSGFTRLNIGITGRGARNFTDAQKEKIKKVMRYYDLPSELQSANELPKAAGK